MKRFMSRLRHEWTKNDGKPWEEWVPGRDLREIVLIVVLVICTALMALAVVAQMVT